NTKASFPLSFRIADRAPELWNPVTGTITPATRWEIINGRAFVEISLDAQESVFVVFREPAPEQPSHNNENQPREIADISKNWKVKFDTAFGGPAATMEFAELKLWNEQELPAVKYYSGAAVYSKSFNLENYKSSQPVFLSIDSLFNIATVIVNGTDCGT